MRRLLLELNKGVLITSILVFLFFGTGLNSEGGNTCLYVCAILLVPIAISTIIYNITTEEERR